MAGLHELQRRLSELRGSAEAGLAQARAMALRAERLEAQRRQLSRLAAGDPDAARRAAALEGEILALGAALADKRAEATQLLDRANRSAQELVVIPIDDLLGQLDDHFPFLLFPVRLETKFAHDSEGTRLRVRIFPDEILISTHDPLLSESEREAGVAFWSARGRALKLAADERRAAERGARNLIAMRFGGPRARYLVRKTRPAVWPPATDVDAAPLAASDEPVRTSSGSAPARARLLPDYFVVAALDRENRVVVQRAGRPIPDALQLTPDPEAAAAELLRDASGRLAASAELGWLVDYERAVDVGMAVTLPVEPQFARTGFDRVIAIGARLSLDPEAGAAAVERLFSDHRFTSGIDILRQGCPTNNTDGADSAFSPDLAADEAMVAQEVDGVAATDVLDHAGKSDAQRFSEALGIAFASVSDWPSAGEAWDVADALAMNRALWPATFGTYLRELIGSRMEPALKLEIERFFLTYVTGRTLLPAIRVGKQPYGVLATSDLRSWVEDSGEGGHGSMTTIVDGLAWFRRHFEEIDRQPATRIAQLGRGDDSLAMTMRVVGQLASSVSFASRMAVRDEVAWNALNFTGVTSRILTSWWDRREAGRNENFRQLSLDPQGLPLAELVFFQDAGPLLVPVVDQDPTVPMSEIDPIAPFDGARNYIHWLLTASDDELRRQVFTNARGEAVDAPRALLYRVLRHAWTTQLAAGANALVARLRPELGTPLALPSIVNVGAQKVVPDGDVPSLDAAKLDLTVNPRSLGDHLLDLSRAGSRFLSEATPEALPLQSQRAALERLADRPTAALERLFAEHIDVASYRLDAWQTGLVSRRMDSMRRRDGRAHGIYVGAYGYVEALVPKAPPRPIDRSALPEKLRDADPVVEQEGNGGFVHAPSLPHAVTAAVLRNGYLTHAEPQRREVLSVNLSSRRVRAAMELVEGMRAGQDLAALLGYQLERGLHEHHPGLELDESIYVLRARFPLVSRRLTPAPPGTPAEIVEARHVIDGYDLLEHVRLAPVFPYGVAGLPTAQDKAEAIQAEIARLEETLDSVADLMTAEAVHQAVQSNVDRARGVVGALSDGEMPPVPEVAQSPRSGRTITQRVALPLPAVSLGWTSPPSPRAQLNARLNTWLVRQLPAPHQIGYQVFPAGATAQVVTLDQTGLDAIDVVLMSADRFGDGSSELERFLADRWRGANGVEDDVLTRFAGPAPNPGEKLLVLDLSTAAGATPLGTLLPHLRALRRLVGAARGLDAEDYRLSTDSDRADPTNPKAYRLDVSGDLDGLLARVESARNALVIAADAVEGELEAMEPLYDAVRRDRASFDASAWSPRLSGLRTRLRDLTLFGTPEALPRSAAGVSVEAALNLYEQGRAGLVAVRKRLERADQALAPLPGETPLADAGEEARRRAARLERRLSALKQAAREVLGPNFPLQPIFNLSFADRVEIEARLADPIAADPLELEAWLQSLARVRPRMADLALASAAAQWATGSEPRLVPVQLPLRAGDPWIGAAWSTAPEEGEVMSVMTVDAPVSLEGDLEGLLIDDWTETIPTARETTGIAFHFDRPNAAAPQALLLAAPPNPDGRWRWNELVGVVLDTFDRARLRAIEPDRIAASPLFSILPMTLLPFTITPTHASTFLADAALRRVSSQE